MTRFGTYGTGVLAPFGLRDDVNNVLRHFFNEVTESADSPVAFTPNASVLERETNYELSIELPGVNSEEFTVEFEDGELVVAGEKKISEAAEGESYLFSQRVAGNFQRKFSFATDVNFELIDAEFANGVLKVTVPKAEKATPKRIEVKVAKQS